MAYTYPQGGWLCPAQLTAAVLKLAEKQGLRCHYQHSLAALHRSASGWDLHFTHGSHAEHAAVVLANGHQINHFAQTRPLPVYAVAGQVSHIPTTPALSGIRQVLCYDGYLTPQNPTNQQHCIGASYHRGSEETQYREDDQQQNRQRLIDCFPGSRLGQRSRCERQRCSLRRALCHPRSFTDGRKRSGLRVDAFMLCNTQ
ncbi:5-methylaminomethyl-2-thiouridine methyltransferase [Citrobacter amalonaticus]|nr:5-methylaminomethyl-2-thiouridine methyltransferase [Citrobacter amalonaticus]